MTQNATLAIEEAFIEEWGRIVAVLIGRTRDWDLAEDCAQQAFAEAARRWPGEGVPRRPGAWLMTVAAEPSDRPPASRADAERATAGGSGLD